jgi:hypothetical protein
VSLVDTPDLIHAHLEPPNGAMVITSWTSDKASPSVLRTMHSWAIFNADPSWFDVRDLRPLGIDEVYVSLADELGYTWPAPLQDVGCELAKAGHALQALQVMPESLDAHTSRWHELEDGDHMRFGA